MDTNAIITFFACILALFLFGRVLVIPLKTILKIVFNSILGGVLIYLINIIGARIFISHRIKYFYGCGCWNIRNSGSNTISSIKNIFLINYVKNILQNVGALQKLVRLGF